GRAYPPGLRPRVFAVFSSAWVIPGLIGPAAAGAIEHALSWRAVFLALLPIVAVAAAMTIPQLSRRAPDEPSPDPPRGHRPDVDDASPHRGAPGARAARWARTSGRAVDERILALVLIGGV